MPCATEQTAALGLLDWRNALEGGPGLEGVNLVERAFREPRRNESNRREEPGDACGEPEECNRRLGATDEEPGGDYAREDRREQRGLPLANRRSGRTRNRPRRVATGETSAVTKSDKLHDITVVEVLARASVDDAGLASSLRRLDGLPGGAAVFDAIFAQDPSVTPESAGRHLLNAAHPVGVLMRDVVEEKVEWLWPGRIPLRKITLVDGDHGLGKSAIATDLAARITTGRPMPDGAPTVQGAVVILSAEDGFADTIRPRLAAARADLTRVLGIGMVGEGDDARLPAIPDDIAEIERGAARVGAVLIIIDPLMAYLSGTVNSHRDQDVRRALAQVSQLADRTGAAVLIVRYLNKNQGGKAIYRGGGSIGVFGAARSVLLVAGDPDDPDDPPTRRILASVKSNLAPPAAPLTYRLVGTASGAVAVEWLGVSEHTASALLAAHL